MIQDDQVLILGLIPVKKNSYSYSTKFIEKFSSNEIISSTRNHLQVRDCIQGKRFRSFIPILGERATSDSPGTPRAFTKSVIFILKFRNFLPLFISRVVILVIKFSRVRARSLFRSRSLSFSLSLSHMHIRTLSYLILLTPLVFL